MEKNALPNAGLYDQRAALQWIHDYIPMLGGDPAQVTQWGQSAGASSIMHHLIAFGGTQDPLFSKAILQSPAYLIMFDRDGYLEDTFKSFASLAGCDGKGLDCLRTADVATLQKANTNLALNALDGTFPVGVSADGTWVRQLASLELASGNYWKDLEGIILSHTSNEATLFVDGHLKTNAEFTTYIDQIFPPFAKTSGINDKIEQQYPAPDAPGSPYSNEVKRNEALVQDSSFTCNVRYLSDAYAGKNWNMQYSVTPAWHGTDLLPSFYDLNVGIAAFGGSVDIPLIPLFGGFADSYQSYMTSFARSGDPNTHRALFNIPDTIHWPKAIAGEEQLAGVLDANDSGFRYVSDGQTAASSCGFWRDVSAGLTAYGGYAPPGAVVQQSLVPMPNSPSSHF